MKPTPEPDSDFVRRCKEALDAGDGEALRRIITEHFRAQYRVDSIDWQRAAAADKDE